VHGVISCAGGSSWQFFCVSLFLSKVRPMTSPTLSVLLPNYNHARFLPQSLGAILAQSYRPLELLIYDDASTDDSVSIIRESIRDIPWAFLHCGERNLGVTAALTRLLNLARGDYVYLSAADDRVLPDFFSTSMDMLARHPQASLCSGLSVIVDASGREIGLRRLPRVARIACYLPPERCLREIQRRDSWITGNCSIYRRDLLVRETPRAMQLGPFFDGFLQKVMALRHGACYIPRPLACWREMESCYSVQSALDVDKGLAVFDRAIQFMRTEYAEIFPASYVDTFRRRKRFLIAYMNLQAERQQCTRGLVAMIEKVVGPCSAVERSFLEAEDRMLRVTTLPACVHLAWRCGVSPAWILERLIPNAIHGLKLKLGYGVLGRQLHGG